MIKKVPIVKKESGFIGKPDVMRAKAHKAFDGQDFKELPQSPSSASAPRKEKMRLYKQGGSVKANPVNKPMETKGGSLTDQKFPHSIAMKKGGKAKVTSELRKAMKGRTKKDMMEHEKSEMKSIKHLEKLHGMNKGGMAYKKGGAVKSSAKKAEKYLTGMHEDNLPADTGKAKNHVFKPANAIKGKEKVHPKVQNGEKMMKQKMAPHHKDKSGVEYCKKGGKVTKMKKC